MINSTHIKYFNIQLSMDWNQQSSSSSSFIIDEDQQLVFQLSFNKDQSITVNACDCQREFAISYKLSQQFILRELEKNQHQMMSAESFFYFLVNRPSLAKMKQTKNMDLHIQHFNINVEWAKQQLSKKLDHDNHDEQCALLAIKIFEFIKNKEYFREQGLSMRQHILVIIATINDQNICKQARRLVGSLFSFNSINNPQRKQYNTCMQRNVFHQIKQRQSILPGNHQVYNPTFTTHEIFSIIYQYANNQIQPDIPILIRGVSGIGKTFSSALLTELSKFICDFTQNNSQSRMTDLVKIPKIFYLSLQENFLLEYMIDSLYAQCPFLQKNISQLRKILIQIVDYYRQRKIKVIFLVDQINLYYSLIRKYEKEKKETNLDNITVYKAIQNTQKAILEIRKWFSIVFSCSQDAQVEELIESNFFQFRTNFLKDISNSSRQFYIGYHQNRRTLSGFFQMINTIFFQMKRVLKKKSKNLCLLGKNIIREKKNKFEQFRANNNLAQKFTIFLYYGMTHLRIYKYFDNKYIQFNSLSEQEKNPKQFDNYLDEIACKCLQMMSKSYQQYFLKSVQKRISINKYIMLFMLRDLAYSQMEMESSPHQFKIKFQDIQKIAIYSHNEQIVKGDFFMLINKDHILIDKKSKQVIIFLSPNEFLHITSFIDQTQIFRCLQMQQVLQIMGENVSTIGSFFDTIQSRIISTGNIVVNLPHHKNIILNNTKKQGFYHFNQHQNNYNISYKFKQIFETLSSQEKKGNYIKIGAQPLVPSEKNTIPHHSNISKAIDCLIIQKQQNYQIPASSSYTLITFDFVVTKNPQYIKKKMNSITNFLIDIKNSAKQQNITFNIFHYFVTTQSIFNYLLNKVDKENKEKKEKKIKLFTQYYTVIPIKQLQITFDKKWNQQKNLVKLNAAHLKIRKYLEQKFGDNDLD